jgi:cytochrome o ubiquinol oxidase subunit 1
MTHSPIPFYNFAVLPHINERDEVAWRRDNGLQDVRPTHYDDIHMPNNTGVAIIIGGLTFVLGFALTWRIWWLCLLSLVAIIVMMIVRSFMGDPGYIISGAELQRMEDEAYQREAQIADQHHPRPVSGGVGGSVMAYERTDLSKSSGSSIDKH